MAVPKQKKSKAKKRSRRANHDRLSLVQTSICNSCGADMISHRACPDCGWYKDRVAIVTDEEEEAAPEGVAV